MQRHEQDLQAAKQATAAEERLLSTLEQIEILHEVIETLNLGLRYKEQQLQELEQELIDTNQELWTTFSLEQISLAQAKALARTIWQTNKSTSDSLAELIGAIYGSAVDLE
ncbi:hypothetical protein [Chlorogloea sp. CCALA 695]|uniref:hypothetical protein n=1 Tax=Chlorogloea sp. CCALA 695 TaxID=2107693 RepID=UPI000D06A245|nr:hypothetical protein [Chlorogloea sp. CCALA 695]PSB26926.1 hypothetical protein C7B70_23235 [Chlorogloea sp. CCALA 695]